MIWRFLAARPDSIRFRRLAEWCGQRAFSTKTCFPCSRGGFRQFKCVQTGVTYGTAVDLRGREQLGRSRRERHVRMSLLDALECGRALIT